MISQEDVLAFESSRSMANRIQRIVASSQTRHEAIVGLRRSFPNRPCSFRLRVLQGLSGLIGDTTYSKCTHYTDDTQWYDIV